MFKEIMRAKKVGKSGRYAMPGFERPLWNPAVIFECDDVSNDFNVGLIAEDYDLESTNPYHTSNVKRGDFYKLVSKKLKSEYHDIFRYKIDCFAILNTMKPPIPVKVKYSVGSVVIFAFAGDGTHRGWLYIESFEDKE